MEENKKLRRVRQNHRPVGQSKRPQQRWNNRLWTLRKKCHLGQKQVAHLMGLKSVANLSRYERGEKLPGLENALKLEFILGVPIRFLFLEMSNQIQRQVFARRARFGGTLSQDWIRFAMPFHIFPNFSPKMTPDRIKTVQKLPPGYGGTVSATAGF